MVMGRGSVSAPGTRDVPAIPATEAGLSRAGRAAMVVLLRMLADRRQNKNTTAER